MKVVRFHEYGDPSKLVLEKVEKPSPKSHEVLVKTFAAGVNFADIRRRINKYVEPTPLPFTPGYEVAGVIEAVGKNVSDFKPGDRVVAMIKDGGYAEYAVVDQKNLVAIPDHIDFDSAVAVPLQGVTAYLLLKQVVGGIENKNVLVHAAAGGVGTFAIQIAKIFGAKNVFATASTSEKLKIAKDLGADFLINYAEDNWAETVLKHTENNGVDVVLEMVGGKIFHDSLKCLAPKGHMIVFGRASDEETLFDPRVLMAGNRMVSGFFINFDDVMNNNKIIEELFTYMKDGKLKSFVGDSYPLAEAKKVHELIENRKTVGKIILRPHDF